MSAAEVLPLLADWTATGAVLDALSPERPSGAARRSRIKDLRRSLESMREAGLVDRRDSEGGEALWKARDGPAAAPSRLPRLESSAVLARLSSEWADASEVRAAPSEGSSAAERRAARNAANSRLYYLEGKGMAERREADGGVQWRMREMDAPAWVPEEWKRLRSCGEGAEPLCIAERLEPFLAPQDMGGSSIGPLCVLISRGYLRRDGRTVSITDKGRARLARLDPLSHLSGGWSSESAVFRAMGADNPRERERARSLLREAERQGRAESAASSVGKWWRLAP